MPTATDRAVIRALAAVMETSRSFVGKHPLSLTALGLVQLACCTGLGRVLIGHELNVWTSCDRPDEGPIIAIAVGSMSECATAVLFGHWRR